MRALAVIAVAVIGAGCRCVVVPDGPYLCDPLAGEDCDGGVDEDAGYTFPDVPCVGEWCWEHPRPYGRVAMRSIFEVAPNDVWVAGSAGVLVHWDGKRWQQVPTGTSASLYRVWGADPRAVWIVGANGLVLEWNGEQLVRHDAGVANDLRGIAPAGRRDLHVVGANGVVARYDGQVWSRPIVPNPQGILYCAAGWPDGGVLALGDFGLLRAAPWREVPRPQDGGAIYGLWVPPNGDVWAYGAAGGLYRNTSGDFTAAENWQAHDAGTAGTVNAVFTLGDHLFWAHNAGLFESTTPIPISTRAIVAVHGLAENDVWAVGQFALLHRTVPDTFFDDHTPAEIASVRLEGVAVLPGGAAWVVGDQHAVMVRDGGTWSRVRSDGNPMFGAYYDVWTAPGAPVIAVGNDPIRLAYWDAGTQRMTAVTQGVTANLFGVWGSGANDIWAVGDTKLLLHFDGMNWSVMPPPSACPMDTNFEDVWGTGPRDVWIVGSHGCVLHWGGSSFTDESLPFDEVMLGVGGLSATEVWVVSVNGRISRRSGPSTWGTEATSSSGLRALRGFEGQMYAVGEFSQLLRRETSGSWRRMVVPVELNYTLEDIDAAPGEGLLVVGDVGTILFRK